MAKGLFLDRDGTLIQHIPYLANPDQVILLPGVKEALRLAQEAGFLLFLFSNQSGIGRGYFSLKDAAACNARMEVLLQLRSPGFTEICIAPEAPSEPSHYRKPIPRFIEEMQAKYHLDLQQSYMVGDAASDIEVARRGHVQPVFLQNPNIEPEKIPPPDLLNQALCFPDLLAWVHHYLTITHSSKN